MNKKILALLLAFSTAASFTLNAFADETSEETTNTAEEVLTEEITEEATDVEVTEEQIEVNEEFYIAQALGLIDSSKNPEDIITRGEAAIATVALIGKKDSGYTTTSMTDVTLGSDVHKAISILVTEKIMSGDGNGAYRPDDAITADELSSLLVNAFGYGLLANNYGGYPNGYRRAATDLDIFDGVTVGSEGIDANEFGKLMYNCLDVNLLTTILSSGPMGYEISDEKVMSLMDLVEIRGVVKQTEISSLYSDNSTREGVARIENVDVFVGETNLESLLGYNVRVYAKEDDDGEYTAIYAMPYRTEVTIVDFDELDVSHDIFLNNSIRYHNEKERMQINDLESNCAIIYNGVYSGFRTMDMVTILDGYVEIIDNDNNGDADVIKINAYKDYVVDTANEEDAIISDKFGKSLDLDEDIYEIVKFTDINGSELAWGCASEWTVLSVFDNYMDGKNNTGRRVITLIASNDSFDGTVSKKGEEDGIVRVEIDDVEYDLSKSYTATGKMTQIQLNSKGTFFLNSYGKIAGYTVDPMAQFEKQVGLLVSIIDVPEEERLIYKIYTQNDEMLRLDAAEKVKIDGYTRKEFERISYIPNYDGADYRQVIQYELNTDGQIKMIDTYNYNTDREDNTSLKRIWDFSKPTLRYRDGANSLGRKVNLTGSTLKFNIPSDQNDTEAYATKASFLMTGPEDAVEAYITTDRFKTFAVVAKDKASTTIEQSKLLLVTDLIYELVDDEPMNKVVVQAMNGVETYYAEDGSTLLNGIDKGDLIAVAKNARGYLERVDLIYDYSENYGSYIGGFKVQHRVFWGKVYEKQGDWFSLVLQPFLDTSKDTGAPANVPFDMNVSDKYNLENFNLGTYKAYTVEVDRRGVTVETATGADLRDYETYGNAASVVIGSDRDDYPRVLFIYK